MPTYKTRSQRIEKGRYRLSYGKGEKALQCDIFFNDVADSWAIDKGDGRETVNRKSPFKRKKDLVAEWGEWAEAAYDQPASRSTPPSPPKRPKKGPPKHKPSLAEKGPPKRRQKPTPPADPEQRHQSDPFDSRFRYASDHPRDGLRRKLTPLGMLVEVEHMLRSSGNDGPALEAAQRCIARECPDLIGEDGNVQSAAEAAKAYLEARRSQRADDGSPDTGGTDDEPLPFD